MTLVAFCFWLTNIVVLAHPSLHQYIELISPSGHYDLQDAAVPVPDNQKVLLLVDGDYSHIDNSVDGADAAELACWLTDLNALQQLQAHELGCLEYAEQIGKEPGAHET